MNIYEYIDNYGIYSFHEKPFNEVDSVIFSFLSYAKFDLIFKEKKSLTIEEAARMHVGLYPNKDNNVIAVKEGNKLLRYLKDIKRYRNCRLFNYNYLGNDEIQFGVISIEYMPNRVFVSFEGTDQLFSGWIEDLMLSYKYPTRSHIMAIEYLNKYYTFSRKKLIIGGHSKGGNLALVAAMNCNLFVRKNIDQILNIDGPGLLNKNIKSYKFKRIKNKYKHIVPNYSLVGMLLANDNEVVVESTNKGILSHNIIYWVIKDDHFVNSKLSKISTEFRKEIFDWSYKYDDLEKCNFINDLRRVLVDANVYSILDLKTDNKKILDLIINSKDLDKKTKKVLVDLLGILINSFKTTKKAEIKDFLTNMFKL